MLWWVAGALRSLPGSGLALELQAEDGEKQAPRVQLGPVHLHCFG